MDPVPVLPAGTVSLSFDHCINGSPFIQNQLIYTNEAGNPYLITEVKYFISDIVFYQTTGATVRVNSPKDIFYIDEDLPSTKTLTILNPVPAGSYDSVSFIFGISEERNKSYMFANPPEVFMGWPEVLGGGYHYMMMNGKWQDTAGIIRPFNFHLGIGQLYHGTEYNVDSIYAYVHNNFRVSLPGSAFTMRDQESLALGIVMNIESWFSTPHIYNHNYWGGGIMQKQPAMQMAKENGYDVFSFRKSSTK